MPYPVLKDAFLLKSCCFFIVVFAQKIAVLGHYIRVVKCLFKHLGPHLCNFSNLFLSTYVIQFGWPPCSQSDTLKELFEFSGCPGGVMLANWECKVQRDPWMTGPSPKL